MDENVFFVGITGLAGAGKDSVADFLMSYAEACHIKTTVVKLSDCIREELEKEGESAEKPSRSALIQTGNRLRHQYGEGILAERASRRYEEIVSDDTVCALGIFSGIRTIGEAQFFKMKWQSKFILLSVLTSHQDRIRRMLERNQYQEDQAYSKKVDRADKEIGILRCIQIADYNIWNDSTLDELNRLVKIFFEARIKPHYSLNSFRK